jgi:peptidoglycan-associated lipoprotein
MKFLTNSFMSVVLLASLTLVSCGSNKKDGEGLDATQAVVDDASNSGMSLELNGDSDSKRAGGLTTVYFDYDSSKLTSSAKSALDANVAFLTTAANIEIQVEGHCDERGGVQYNLALGERRAKSVKDYLAAKGINAKRVTTVSYGKERPVEFGHDDAAWGKNRRANFVITAK